MSRGAARRSSCGRPGFGDGRPELRGDARADRQRDPGGCRLLFMPRAVPKPVSGRSAKLRRAADDEVEQSGTVDRRRRRSRRTRSRVPDPWARSLSPQGGGGFRAATGLGAGCRPICGAGELDEGSQWRLIAVVSPRRTAILACGAPRSPGPRTARSLNVRQGPHCA